MNEIEGAVALAKSPEHASLEVGGQPMEIVSLRGREAVSQLFELTMIAEAPPGAPSPDELVGSACALSLDNRLGPQRRIEGIVAEVADRVGDDGKIELELTLVPQVFLLTLGRDSRVFQHMTVPQIVAEVLKRSPQKVRWALQKSYRERVYTAQYREDDWTFVSRLLESEGIYYWFDEDDGTTLVFSDDSTDAPAIEGGVVPFEEETGMSSLAEHLHAFGEECQATPTKFTVKSFNEQNPALDVSASVGDEGHEMYDAGGAGPIEPDHCVERAQVRHEQATSHRHTFRGEGTCMRLVPGKQMTLAGHARHDGDHFITQVDHRLIQRRRFASTDGEPLGYRSAITAVAKPLSYRPTEDTPEAKQAGLQTGRVVGPGGEEIHTDERGRVRVQLHWDREGGWDDQAGKWMRVTQRGVSSSMLLPRIGWNVTTYMEEGAVDAPTVLSRLHDAEHMPTYPLPDNKTRTVFRTMTSPGDGTFNEITFEDIAGAQLMFLNAAKDMNYAVLDSRNDSVVHNQVRNIAGNQDLTIGTERLEKVNNDQTWTTNGDEKVKIADAREKNVGGDETVKIGGNFELISKAKFQNTVQQTRKLTVTGAATEKCEGNIGLRVGKSLIDVGVDLNRNCEAQMNEEMGKHTQTISANKLETSGGDNVLNVNLDYQETVTGNYATSTPKRFLDSADQTADWTIQGPLSGAAPYIHVEAKDLIELVVGGSMITIDKQSVTVVASAYDLSNSPQLIAKSATIKQN